jgi:hypothetical protein
MVPSLWPLRKAGSGTTVWRPGSGYLVTVPLLWVRLAALLAHASYAAAGPVNRADGDANNDPIHPVRQRL